jgi:phosphoribosyl-ATP pyrophosphohydrolase
LPYSERLQRTSAAAILALLTPTSNILTSGQAAREYGYFMNDSLERLFASILAARNRDPAISRTSKLFRDGVQKMAKKLVEESIEVGLDAVQMNRQSVILESADVLYHLAVIWAECGISPEDVMGELDRRERLYGIAEKLPKQASASQLRRLTPMFSRRKISS